jgi:hypothetical protein
MKESQLFDTSRKINRFDVYYISEAGPRIWKTLDPKWQGTVVDFVRLQHIDPLDKIDIVLSGNFLDDFEARRILLFCLNKISNRFGVNLLITKKIEKTLQQNIKERRQLDERISLIRAELESHMDVYRTNRDEEAAALLNVVHMCLSYSPSIAARNALFTLMDKGIISKEQCVKTVHSVFYPEKRQIK